MVDTTLHREDNFLGKDGKQSPVDNKLDCHPLPLRGIHLVPHNLGRSYQSSQFVLHKEFVHFGIQLGRFLGKAHPCCLFVLKRIHRLLCIRIHPPHLHTNVGSLCIQVGIVAVDKCYFGDLFVWERNLQLFCNRLANLRLDKKVHHPHIL